MGILEFLKEIKTGEWAIVFATVMGPILAVQAQKRLEVLRERFNRKVWVFSTLQATRGQRLSLDHVRALNMIDVAFYGSKLLWFRWQSAAEKAVTIAWTVYLDNLGTDTTGYGDAQWAVLESKRTELFIDLLAAISRSVGYDFDRVHLAKSVYVPVAHGKQEVQEQALRDALVQVFSGSKALKMDVASVPMNSEAQAASQKMIQQLIEATTDGHLHVRLQGDDSEPR